MSQGSEMGIFRGPSRFLSGLAVHATAGKEAPECENPIAGVSMATRGLQLLEGIVPQTEAQKEWRKRNPERVKGHLARYKKENRTKIRQSDKGRFEAYQKTPRGKAAYVAGRINRICKERGYGGKVRAQDILDLEKGGAV